MEIVHKKPYKIFQKKRQENLKISPTVHKGMHTLKNGNFLDEEYEVVECTVSPVKIICPDCGGITLEGLDYCNKCGGELTTVE